MNNEPNREQELTEKELKGIVGGASEGYERPEKYKVKSTEIECGPAVVTGGYRRFGDLEVP